MVNTFVLWERGFLSLHTWRCVQKGEFQIKCLFVQPWILAAPSPQQGQVTLPGADCHKVNVPSFGKRGQGLPLPFPKRNFLPALQNQNWGILFHLRRWLWPHAHFNYSMAVQDLWSAVPFLKDALIAQVGRAQHGECQEKGFSMRLRAVGHGRAVGTGFHCSRGEKTSGVMGIKWSDQKGKGQKRCVWATGEHQN